MRETAAQVLATAAEIIHDAKVRRPENKTWIETECPNCHGDRDCLLCAGTGRWLRPDPAE
jgi:hypothetical protein